MGLSTDRAKCVCFAWKHKRLSATIQGVVLTLHTQNVSELLQKTLNELVKIIINYIKANSTIQIVCLFVRQQMGSYEQLLIHIPKFLGS